MDHLIAETFGQIASECVVHERQDRVRGSERILKLCRIQRRFCVFQSRIEIQAHIVEFLGVRALERIDRLLFITDHENGALLIGAGTFASGKFTRQCLNHIPLRWAGVLGLINQNVVNPAVQLEQHPFRHFRAFQKVPRFQDEIVEIEQATLNFAVLIGRNEHLREIVEEHGAVEGSTPLEVLKRSGCPIHPRMKIVDHGGESFDRFRVI